MILSADMGAKEETLVFVALCSRYRSAKTVHRTMSREELQQVTGLDAEVLEETIKGLRGPDAYDDSCIAFEGERVVLGPAWRQKCRALPRDPAEDLWLPGITGPRAPTAPLSGPLSSRRNDPGPSASSYGWTIKTSAPAMTIRQRTLYSWSWSSPGATARSIMANHVSAVTTRQVSRWDMPLLEYTPAAPKPNSPWSRLSRAMYPTKE